MGEHAKGEGLPAGMVGGYQVFGSPGDKSLII